MTYGERVVEIKDECEMINGHIRFINMPIQMNKEDTIVYYGNKLREYWENQVTKKQPLTKKGSLILDFMMGRITLTQFLNRR